MWPMTYVVLYTDELQLAAEKKSCTDVVLAGQEAMGWGQRVKIARLC